MFCLCCLFLFFLIFATVVSSFLPDLPKSHPSFRNKSLRKIEHTVSPVTPLRLDDRAMRAKFNTGSTKHYPKLDGLAPRDAETQHEAGSR